MSPLQFLIRGRAVAAYCTLCKRHVRLFGEGVMLTTADVARIEKEHSVMHADVDYTALHDGLYDEDDQG